MPENKTSHAARVAGKNGFSLLNDETFRELYAALLQCSLLDSRLRKRSGYEPWTGCEAGTAGVVTCLRPGDTVTPTPRGLLAGYLRNGALDIRVGKTAPDAASHLAMATGDALRHKLEKLGNIAVVFAATGESDAMRAAFSAAEQQSLPVIYVLEVSPSLADVSRYIPVIRVDAADTVAVYRVAHESIFRAREGGGPTIMECAKWPDDGGDTDPLVKLENYLSARKLFRRDWKQRLEKKYSRKVEEAASSAILK
jgi:Dehydrogenase E1 component